MTADRDRRIDQNERDEFEIGKGRYIGTPRGGAQEAARRNERMREVDPVVPAGDLSVYTTPEDLGINTRDVPSPEIEESPIPFLDRLNKKGDSVKKRKLINKEDYPKLDEIGFITK